MTKHTYTVADIDNVWHAYRQLHGELPTPSTEEAMRGIKKLWKAAWAGYSENDVYLDEIVHTSTTRVGFINAYLSGEYPGMHFRVYLHRSAETWPKLCAQMARARYVHDSNQLSNATFYEHWYRLARIVCDRGWLTGALLPEPKPKIIPTKADVRAAKIARLETRLAAWETKRKRADTAISKINRSLNALRRYQNADAATTDD